MPEKVEEGEIIHLIDFDARAATVYHQLTHQWVDFSELGLTRD